MSSLSELPLTHSTNIFQPMRLPRTTSLGAILTPLTTHRYLQKPLVLVRAEISTFGLLSEE